MIVTKFDMTYDVPKLWNLCSQLIERHDLQDASQVGLTHRIATEAMSADAKFADGVGSLKDRGLRERDFIVLHEACHNTYIEELLRSIPFMIGRVRIMKMRGRCCYSVHVDSTKRVHLPLVTNPQALMLFPEHGTVVHLPADGHMYLTDTTLPHTAMNGGLADRYHLVAALAEAIP